MARKEKQTSDFFEILSVFRKRIWLLGFFIIGVLAVIFMYNELVPPLYVTEFSIIYEELMQPIPDLEFYQSQQRRETISNQIEELNSRQFFMEVSRALSENLVNQFKVPEEITDDNSLKKYLSYFIKKNTRITTPDNNSNVIRISYINEHANVALGVAETIVKVIDHRTIAQRKQYISSTRQLIEDQLVVYKTQLDSAEKLLRDFKETRKISSLNNETEELLRQITEAEVLLTSAKANRQATKQRIEYIRQKIQTEQKELMPDAMEVISPRLDKLKDKLVELELQRTDLIVKGYSNHHPKLMKLAEEIEQTRENLALETQQLIQKGKFIDPLSQLKDLLQESITLEANLSAYEAQVETLQRILAEYEKKLRLLPDLELQLARLVRDVDTNEKIYTMLMEERERTRIVEAQNTGNIRVIDPPDLPIKPIRPRKTLNLIIGLFLGCVIGSIMVFILETLDTRIKTSDDIKRFTEVVVLGTIPKIRKNVNGHLDIFDPSRRPEKEEINRLITLYESQSYAAEAFRMLRTNLQFSSSDFRSNSILVTSPQPGEGKSTTAINLAITTAQLGYETLLIDADLRRPILHKIFRINREPGLVDILHSNSFQKLMQEQINNQKRHLWDDLISVDQRSDSELMVNEPYNMLVKNHKFQFESLSTLYAEIGMMVNPLSNIEHLSLLTSGTAVENSSEVLGSRLMTTFISLIKRKYDVIFIDSPPVLVVTDTSVLGSLVDGVLIVCIAGKTQRRTIARAIELLEKGRTKILGLVLNKSLEESLPRHYKKYYQTCA